MEVESEGEGEEGSDAEEGEDEQLEDEGEAKKKEGEGSKKEDSAPIFPAISATELAGKHSYVKVTVPPHRYTPLRSAWPDIYKPIVEHMKLQIRFDPKKRWIELKTSSHTESAGAMQKSVDFIRAFLLGFEIRDAIALLRLDDLFIDSFQIKDVKTLEGEHLSRAIGRIAGQEIGRAVQQECRDRSRMPSSA
eukprot:TRINITY_DN2547_c0_g1_i5.p1 TRINITY_DN2547_c0_g1~~TRINITY_DN2547_c0_g1_i5.p1  ORF type:complete len:192 (-),score=40.11 TRINITY_DN2547_c0_g1_i5:15-590(-)